MSRQLPGRFIRSKTGLCAYVVQTRKRHEKTREPLLRLRYADGVIGPPIWTRTLLDLVGVTWLKRRPKGMSK